MGATHENTDRHSAHPAPLTGRASHRRGLCDSSGFWDRGVLVATVGRLRHKRKKKQNRQPQGGMGGRHAATTQGF